MAFLVAACSTPEVPNNGGAVIPEVIPSDTFEPPVKQLVVEELRLMALWDSLVGDTTAPWVTDSAALTSTKEWRDPILYFDHEGAVAFYKRKGASMLVYADSTFARNAFERVADPLGADPSKRHIGQFELPTRFLVSSIFSKSGSTHLLSGRVIVHLLGSCAESRQEVDRRLHFAEILSGQGLLRGTMSMRCGWGGLKIIRAAWPTTS
ncbi:MAG: hypothetical protein IPM49_13445 [Flavobacteriales bacterium]|nr:hypothetical protein [Flavobacteriales bacterium]